jgi:hypothetical protein
MYNVEKIVEESGGKSYIKSLIEDEGYSQQEIQKILGITTSSRITYKKFVDYCQAVIPFPKVSNQSSRKWMIRWTKNGTEYWNDQYLVDETLQKLSNPILNKTGTSKRYNISMWGHPNANEDSYQVRAHQIVWELDNECFLPEGHEVEAIDGNFLNLDITNLRARLTVDRKSFYSSGERNHFYTGVQRYVNYSRGWTRKSKIYREKIGKCEICSSLNNLNSHHIISYWLFEETDIRVHSDNNLLCVCDSCHGTIHQQNTTIVPHISEMKYKNLLELLESLKSQVPDALMETYKDVEKQLGLTDNQQPST